MDDHRKTKPKLYIEMTGVPGAGKTTVTTCVLKRLQEKNMRTKTRGCISSEHTLTGLRRYLEGLRFLMHHPRILLKLLTVVTPRVTCSQYVSLLKGCSAQFYATQSPANVVLYDQGLINTLLNFQHARIDWNRCYQLYQTLLNSIPFYIAVIETDPHIAQTRAKNRAPSGHFTETDSPAQIAMRYTLFDKQKQSFQTAWPKQHQLLLNGEHSVAQTAQELLNIIHPFMK